MTANTGRTVSKWVAVHIGDTANAMRTIPVNSLNGVGLAYTEADVTAWMDAIKGALPEQPDCVLTLQGPFDTSAAATQGALSGSHTILSADVGGVIPRSVDVQIGIRHAWESGEPQFGITRTATSGFLIRTYEVDLSSMTYTATLGMYPGSSAPAWGTTAEAGS
jgi:hypothetical protein